MQVTRQVFARSFKFPYFIHAGFLDAITTIFALGLGFSELNPIVNSIYPEYIFLIPAILIAFAYLRGLSVQLLFKNKKYFKPMTFFTLYFPALFNLTGIVLFLTVFQDVVLV